MSTRLQKRLAKAIVMDAKNKRPRQKKDLLVSIGYSKVTAEAIPSQIIESKGVREELKNLGFSEDGAKKVVSEILYSEKAKHHDRLDAADKVFKVHGSYAPDKHVNLNVEAKVTEDAIELAKRLLDSQNGNNS